MSRRGNCHDNIVAERFFSTFKKRVTKKNIYDTREEAKREIFNFIEMFHHPMKRHSHTGGVSPVKFEEDYFFEARKWLVKAGKSRASINDGYLTESQRAMVVARVSNLSDGQRSEHVQGTPIDAASKFLNVRERSINRAKKVQTNLCRNNSRGFY